MTKSGTREKSTSLAVRIGRWSLALLLLSGLAGGAVWSTLWLAAPDNVPLERVRINGDIRHTKRALLERTLAVQLRGSFFSLDLDSVREAAESLPWVERASVRRVWPGTLDVGVRERQALARWGVDKVVSPRGEVFQPDPGSVPTGLAHLSGPADSAREVVDRYVWMRRRLAARGLDIARLALSNRHAWFAELGDGVSLYLGNGDLEQRLERFLRHFPELQGQGDAEQVDMRYANGFAVRWRPRPDRLEQEKAGVEG